MTLPAACHASAVSVCMATYNGATYLRVQIDSIISQLKAGDELVVSDDGSTDATLEILRSYGSRLSIVGTSRVAGVVPNFARALAHASRPLIMLADQDDAWLPGRLAAMTAELAHCELVVANALVVDENLVPTGVTLFDQLPPSTSFSRNLWKNTFVGCCMAFRRTLLQRALPMPAHTPWHDWLLGLLACLGSDGVRHLQAPMLLYRRHASNASATGQASQNSFRHKLSLRTHMILALWACRQRARSLPTQAMSTTTTMLATAPPNVRRPRVLVLMATFNGEQWLLPQLQSIAAQRDVELSLMVSDDASGDGTVGLLRDFCAHRLDLRLLQASMPSGSAGRNFIRLMLAADAGGHDYVALCDQDDEWHPDKLSRAADRLERSDAGGYSAAVRAFWPDGRTSLLRQSQATTLADYVFEGAGQGCTFVLRADAFRAAQRLLQQHRELLEPLHYHDWLLYALCRAQGQTWLFDARPCMRYRQHAGNDTGARSNGAGLMKRLRLIRSGWYGAQVETIARVCVAAVGTRSVGACRYLALIDSSPNALSVRLRLCAFVVMHGRRRFTDRCVLLLAAAAAKLTSAAGRA